MDFALTDQDVGNENKYKFAGRCAIISSILLVFGWAISIIYEIPATSKPSLLPIIFITSLIQIPCGAYPYYRFREYLNVNYDFHKIDNFVIPLIVIWITISVAGLAGYIYPGLELIFMIIWGLLGIISVVLMMIYSIILLQLQPSSKSLLKTYTYTMIGGCICCLVVFLIPVGFVMLAATDFMLGLILLKPKEEMQVDFV